MLDHQVIFALFHLQVSQSHDPKIYKNRISGAKSDGLPSSGNPGKVCADRIQFQLTLHEEEEEENPGSSSEPFDSTIVSGHSQDDHTMV